MTALVKNRAACLFSSSVLHLPTLNEMTAAIFRKEIYQIKILFITYIPIKGIISGIASLQMLPMQIIVDFEHDKPHVILL